MLYQGCFTTSVQACLTVVSADLLSALLALISAIRHTWLTALHWVLVPLGGIQRCQVIGQRNFYPGASQNSFKTQTASLGLKRVGTELPENRTEPVHYLNSQNENSQRMRKAKCSKSQLRRPTVYQDQEQSKEQDREIDIKTVDTGTLQDSGAKVGEMLEDPEKLEQIGQ